MNIATLIPATRTDLTTSAATPALVSFFSGITGGAFSLEGEGVLSIRVFMVDYAENKSLYNVVYKIDKTGPQLSFKDITESTDYTHYGGEVDMSMVVSKNDSSITVSNQYASFVKAYPDPAILSYANNHVATAQASHTRTKLHAFYFQNNTTGAGSSSPFVANTAYSDSYNSYLTPTGASPIVGGYNGPLVSGEKGFQLLDESNTAIGTVGGLGGAYTTANLISNGANAQKKYKLRLYDNTVDMSGGSGNYSETAFYAVRDNVAPNMGGNGLAGTDLRAASELLLGFPDATAYDKTAYANGYVPEAGGVSRFFAAGPMSLKFKLNDTGITGNGTTGGAGCTDYKICNAGINAGVTTVNVEDSASPGTYPVLTTFSNRFVNDLSATKNFNLANNGTLAANGTYRKYGIQYASSSLTQLCDYVGNCIAPQIGFRVVANTVDNAASNMKISSQSTTADGKIIANGSNSYKLSYTLMDAYGNKVVPVKAEENSDIQIKAVDSTLMFDNGLNVNQLRNSGGSGVKLVGAVNLLPTKITTFANQINTTGTVDMTEGMTSNPAGVYEMSLSSSVPTSGAYPYVSDKTRLSVQSLTNKTDRIQAAAGMTYPASGARIGYGTTTANATTTAPLVAMNNGGIGEIGGTQNISLDTVNYGKVSYVDAAPVSLASLVGRYPNFEFASPYVYGLNGMRVLIDGQYGDHMKKLYTIDSGVPNYNIYEKYVVAHDTDKDEQPKWLDYKIRSVSAPTPKNMSEGIRYTTNGNFPIFGSNMTQQSYNISGATGSGFAVEVQMSSKPTLIYDNAKLRTGFVSALTYEVGANTVQLPSVGRGLTKADGTTAFNQYEMVRNYFDDTYTIGKTTVITTPTTLAATITNIAIIGLVNNYNTNTTDVNGTNKNVNVEGELNRTALIANIKQNVAAVSRGIGPNTATTGKHWCAGGTFNDLASASFDSCTVDVNGEKIVFIDGNAIVKCSGGSGNTCMVNDKRAIIVKNGSLYIKSNISTLTTSHGMTNGQLFFGVMNDTGLANVTVDPADVNIADASKYSGWMFVDPKITNIDAFLFAQGPMVSYSDDALDMVNGKRILFSKANTTEQKLRNQLSIYGSILTLNTITGSRQATPECPYNVDNCTEDVAQIFDFVYTRRFVTGPASLCSPFDLTDTRTVPYHPLSPDMAKWAGGKTGSFSASSNELRSIDDATYRPYPMIIERDLQWNSSPSRLFQVNR